MKKKLLLLSSLIFALSLNTGFAEERHHEKDAEREPNIVQISHGISLYGDLKYKQGFSHFDYVNPDAPKGGEIRFAAMGSFDSLNPHILKGTPAKGLGLTFDTLMAQSYDETSSNYGLIAEFVEIPADRSWVTFTINPKAKWNNGKQITVDDVIFSFDTIKTKGSPFYKAYYRDILSAEKIADNKVRFIFRNNTNHELPLIVGSLPIISREYWVDKKFENSSLEIPVTSGPYKISSFDAGKSIVYERDSNYWGKDLPVNKGRYNFDKVKYEYYRDDTVAIEALKKGEYDFREENIAKNWATAYNISQVAEGRMVREEIRNEMPTGMQAFAINSRKAKFMDVKVRKALNYAFDFESINKSIMYNAYARTESYFSNSDYASRGLPEGDELAILEQYRDKISESVFQEFSLPKTDGSGDNRDNLLKARDLLAEAGWKLQNGKLVDKYGDQFTIEFIVALPAFERIVIPYTKSLDKLGIQSNVRVLDISQYQKRLDEFDFDIAMFNFGQSLSPGNEQINYWHSSRADIKGSKNLAGIKDKVVDELVEKVIASSSQEELISSTRALDRVLLSGYYVIPNWHTQKYRLVYWNKFSRPNILAKYDLELMSWWYADKTASNR